MPFIVSLMKSRSHRISVGDAVVTCVWRNGRFVVSIDAPKTTQIDMTTEDNGNSVADVPQDVVKR